MREELSLRCYCRKKIITEVGWAPSPPPPPLKKKKYYNPVLTIFLVFLVSPSLCHCPPDLRDIEEVLRRESDVAKALVSVGANMNAVNLGTSFSNFDDDDDRSIFTSRHCQVSIVKRKTCMRTRMTTVTGILNLKKNSKKH